MTTIEIPIAIDKELVALFFKDMVHDFCDEYDLSKDFETDLQFLLLLFGSVFGEECYNYIYGIIDILRRNNGTKDFSPSNFMDLAEEYAYDNIIVPKGRNFWGFPIVQDDDVLLTRIDSYEELGSESSMMTNETADWCVLQAGRFYGSNRLPMDIHGNTTFSYTSPRQEVFEIKQIQPVYIIEDATKSSKQIPILYAENINTYMSNSANSKNVVSLQTLPGIYDEANNTLIQGNEVASVGPNSIKAVNTSRLLEQNVRFTMLAPSEHPIFVANMVNQSTVVQRRVDIISLTTQNLFWLIRKSKERTLLDFIVFLTTGPIFHWLATNWKEEKSGLQFINLLQHGQERDVSQNGDTTPIGDIFDTFTELYFGSLNQDDGTTSPNIAPNLIKEIKDTNSMIKKETEPPTQPSNLTTLLNVPTFKSTYKKVVETKINTTGYKNPNPQQLQFLLKNLSCKDRVCSYTDVVSGSTNGENIEDNKNIGWIARKISTGILEHVLENSGMIPNGEDINEGLKQMLITVLTINIFGIDSYFDQSGAPIFGEYVQYFNIETFVSSINSKFVLKPIASVQFTLSESVFTQQKQIPSAVSVAGDFFRELIDKRYGVTKMTKPDIIRNANYQQILVEEMNGPRKEGLSNKLATIILECMTTFIHSGQSYVGNAIYQKLFLLFFQKTFSDFSQIVITNYLSKNKEFQKTNADLYFPQSVWAISFDKMMTLIALYYGTNIIRQGVSQGPLDRGYVCYGFSNWGLLKTLSEAEMERSDQPICSLTELLRQKNTSFDIDKYPESYYSPGAQILNDEGAITNPQGGKKRAYKINKKMKTKKHNKKSRKTKKLIKINKKRPKFNSKLNI